MRQRLTDKGIRGLKAPAEGQIDIWDQVLPGFGVRVGYGGRKAFIVGTRINGKFRRITLKPAYPHLELAEARSQAKQIIADAQAGIGPDERKKRDAKKSFRAVADAFMVAHGNKLRTRKEVRRKIDIDLRAWHDLQISDIKREDIQELVREKAATSPIAANRLISQITKIFNWAVKESIIKSSPAVLLDRPGEETERERNLSAEEIRTVWAAFDEIGYPWGPLFKMLLVTGQRRGEVAGMRWSEITAEGWLLPGERAKKGKGHLVPLSTLAREIFGGVPEIGDLVFRSRNDKPLQGWTRAIDRARQLSGLKSWHLHDLRRTFATQLRSIGVDRLVVSKLLNHAEAGVTKVYDRWAADPEKTAAMERWANRLREIISGGKAKRA
jgi:integrase